MARRGTYRGIYSSLPDDPDFQTLTPHARLLFYTARCCPAVGPGCIFRFYPEVLAKQSGLSLREVSRALTELQAADWVRVEGPILWIRNGLRYDPTFRLADPKHQKAVMTKLESLPRLQIVLTFCDYYDLPRPFEDPSKGPCRPIPEVGGSSAPIPISDTEYRVPISDTEQERTPCVLLAQDASPSSRFPPKILERVPSLTRWPDPAVLVDLWNDAAARYGYAKVETFSSGRRAKAKAYIRTFPDWRFWVSTFAAVRLSRFLMGQSRPTNGHGSPFRADFDWLLTKGKDGTENAVKVHDGRYDDQETLRT